MGVKDILRRLAALEAANRPPAPRVTYILRCEGDPAPITGPCIKMTWGDPETDDDKGE